MSPPGKGPSGFRPRGRALSDRVRDRNRPGDNLSPDPLDLGDKRARHFWADRAEADAAVSKGKAGGAAGLEGPAHKLLNRVEDGHVQPLHRARQDVPSEAGLVDINSDPPDSILSCRLEYSKPAGAGDLEHDSRSLRDLAQGHRSPSQEVDAVVGVAVEYPDARSGRRRPCPVAGKEPFHRQLRLPAPR